MKKINRIIASILVIFLVGISGHLYWLNNLKGNEQFPLDTFLDNESNKTALIIVAHDDDAIGCAGTITELTKKGWNVSILPFMALGERKTIPFVKRK